MLISANTQSGQSKSPQKRNFCKIHMHRNIRIHNILDTVYMMQTHRSFFIVNNLPSHKIRGKIRTKDSDRIRTDEQHVTNSEKTRFQ